MGNCVGSCSDEENSTSCLNEESVAVNRLFHNGSENTSPKIKVNFNYKLSTTRSGTTIYKGLFGLNRTVAVKVLDKKFKEKADKEIRILEQIDDSENIIRFFCHEITSDHCYIALELCICDLENLKRHPIRNQISNKEILRQLSNGVQHLHDLSIVHRDLNPRNILISDFNNKLRVKICDFELAVILPKITENYYVSLNSGERIPEFCGWIAPEIINQNMRRVGKKSDIYSLGYVYFYVVSNGQKLEQIQFPALEQKNTSKVDRWFRSLQFEKTSYCFKDENEASNHVLIRTLIKNMICFSGESRYSINDVIIDPYFWSAHKTLQFIKDFSKYLENTYAKNDEKETKQKFNQMIFTRSQLIIRKDWSNNIDPKLMTEIQKNQEKPFKTNNIVHLIRAIRNLLTHMDDTDVELQNIMGRTDEDIKNFWLRKFPLLIEHMWNTVRKNRHSLFNKYFQSDF